MSGIVGHTMYGILAAKAAQAKRLPISGIIHRHYASFLCGAYLGCDVQTMPEAICVDTKKEVGYGTAPLDKSPLTGGQVTPWSLKLNDVAYRPQEIHRTFYGRAHLVFGWSVADRKHVVPWDHLADYCAAVVQDAIDLYGPGQRQLAYLFGWVAHVVGDSLIKSIQPGVDLHLLDGKYTAKNRPIQDLVTFHEIGRQELGLNWATLLTDLAATPVEPIQFHYMRVAQPRGELATQFPNAWAPHLSDLLSVVLKENRRYQAIRNERLLKLYALKKIGSSWKCHADLSRTTGGLSYAEMIEQANQSGFRHALWQIGEQTAAVYEQIIQRCQPLAEVSIQNTPTWNEISLKWRRSK